MSHRSLQFLSTDIYQSPELREAAKSALASDSLVNEFTTTLVIMFKSIDEWTRAPVAMRTLWTRNKWRCCE